MGGGENTQHISRPSSTNSQYHRKINEPGKKKKSGGGQTLRPGKKYCNIGRRNPGYKSMFFLLVCFSCERAELNVQERKTWVAETLQTRLKEKDTPLLSEQSTN